MNDLRPEMLNPEFLLEHIRRDTKFDADLLEKIISEWKRYKATGLDPDMVVKTAELAFFVHENGLDRLRDLLAAEKDGRLAICPVLLHQTIYRIFLGEVLTETVIDARYDPFKRRWLVRLMGGANFFWHEYFGKDVFLTREEAEAALRGEEHG